jgi:serine phosphatase RsbU (regulator of sigma subunit)
MEAASHGSDLSLRTREALDKRPDPSFDHLTRAATRLLGVPMALVSLVDDERQLFKSAMGLPEPVASAGQTPLTHSFCREIVASSSPLIVADARRHPLLRDNPAIPDLGVIAYAGFPLFVGQEPVGAFCAIDTRPHEWTQSELELVRDIAAMAQTQLDLQAASIAARQGRADAERGQAGAEAVTEVLRRLTALTDVARDAQGLDDMLTAVVRTSAHALAAPVAVVSLVGHDGRLEPRGAIGLVDGFDGIEWPAGEGFAGTVLAEDRVLAIGDLDAAGLGGSPAAAGLQAALGAPLHADGRPTGVIFVADRARRAWSELEIQLLRLSAERLAISLERARIADEQRDVADRLQRALEPTRLPRLHGLRLAGRYEPAELRIGGDWYDAFDLPDSRVGLVIGDVVGHGIEAAAAAVRLRHFLRGYVLRGYGPGQAIGALDTLVLEEPDAAYSSMVYAELDLRTGGVRWASAGHLPPVLLRGGAAEPLDSLGGALLGVSATEPWPERTDVLRRGDRFVLYTDGLVERPGVPIDQDIVARFGEVAEEADLERMCDRLVRGRPDTQRDDVAVLAAAID